MSDKSHQETYLEDDTSSLGDGKSKSAGKRKTILFIGVAVVVIALTIVGLSVGLSKKPNKKNLRQSSLATNGNSDLDCDGPEACAGQPIPVVAACPSGELPTVDCGVKEGSCQYIASACDDNATDTSEMSSFCNEPDACAGLPTPDLVPCPSGEPRTMNCGFKNGSCQYLLSACSEPDELATLCNGPDACAGQPIPVVAACPSGELPTVDCEFNNGSCEYIASPCSDDVEAEATCRLPNACDGQPIPMVAACPSGELPTVDCGLRNGSCQYVASPCSDDIDDEASCQLPNACDGQPIPMVAACPSGELPTVDCGLRNGSCQYVASPCSGDVEDEASCQLPNACDGQPIPFVAACPSGELPTVDCGLRNGSCQYVASPCSDDIDDEALCQLPNACDGQPIPFVVACPSGELPTVDCGLRNGSCQYVASPCSGDVEDEASCQLPNACDGQPIPFVAACPSGELPTVDCGLRNGSCQYVASPCSDDIDDEALCQLPNACDGQPIPFVVACPSGELPTVDCGLRNGSCQYVASDCDDTP